MEENDFGLAKVDNTPMGLIGMEGRFYSGMAENKKSRSLCVRVCVILCSFIFFLAPGVFFLGLGIFTFNDLYHNGLILNLVGGILLGFLLSAVGIKIIVSNIRKTK